MPQLKLATAIIAVLLAFSVLKYNIAIGERRELAFFYTTLLLFR